MILREPSGDDWADVLDLANRSVSSVPDAPVQERWLENRKSFNTRAGQQFHRIAVDPATGSIVGYVAAEIEGRAGASARLFVVTTPDLLDNVGAELLACGLDAARRFGASNADFVEYAGGATLITFLEDHGFRVTSRFEIREGERTQQIVRLQAPIE